MEDKWINLAVLVVIALLLAWYWYLGTTPEEERDSDKPSALQPVFGALICTGGIATGGYQVYLFLKEGIWEMTSIIDVLVWLEMKWAIDPDDWLGVWKILDKIPVGLVLIIIGALVIHNYDSQIIEYNKNKITTNRS